MKLKTEFQVMFNNKTVNQNRVDESIKLCYKYMAEFDRWKYRNFWDMLTNVSYLNVKTKEIKNINQLIEMFNQDIETYRKDFLKY